MKLAFILLATVATGCGSKSSVSNTSDQFSGNHFLYLDRTDRQRIVSDLKDMVLDNYVLLSIKSEANIVANPDQLFTEAIANEAAVLDPPANDEIALATANLRFLDRTYELIAKFKDTHFSASAIVAIPRILNGLELARVNGQVQIVGLRPQILSFVTLHAANPADYQKIAAGVIVRSIDGISADAAAAKLATLVSASSPEFADARAVAGLSQRGRAYPENSYSDWELQSLSGEIFTVRLPYFYAEAIARKDAQFYLRSKGFQSLKDLQLQWNETSDAWAYNRSIPTSGYYPYDPINGMIGNTSWNAADDGKLGTEVLRTGYILRAGKAYGVLQIFGFSAHELTLSTSGTPENINTFASPIAAFVKALKGSATPLIIDLRTNGGGDPMNSVSVLSAIAASNAVYPATTRALRVTRVIRQMIDSDDLQNLPNFNQFDYDATALAELRSAVADHREYTRAFSLTSDITPDPRVGGYDQPVVALITPNCISACDGMSMLLRDSRRATLIGTHTNGTGAGFIGSGSFEDIQWHDRYEVLSLRIPKIGRAHV